MMSRGILMMAGLLVLAASLSQAARPRRVYIDQVSMESQQPASQVVVAPPQEKLDELRSTFTMARSEEAEEPVEQPAVSASQEAADLPEPSALVEEQEAETEADQQEPVEARSEQEDEPVEEAEEAEEAEEEEEADERTDDEAAEEDDEETEADELEESEATNDQEPGTEDDQVKGETSDLAESKMDVDVSQSGESVGASDLEESSRAFQRRLMDLMVSEAKEVLMAAMPDRSAIDTFRFLPLFKPKYSKKHYGPKKSNKKAKKTYKKAKKQYKKARKQYKKNKKPKASYGVPKPQAAYGVPHHKPKAAYGAPIATYAAPAQSYNAPATGYSAPASPSYSAPVAPSYAAPAYEPPAAPAYEPPTAPAYEPPAAPAYEPPVAAPVYEPPALSYSASQSNYGAPKPAYGSPKPTYSAPQPSYGAPKPAYEAPTKGKGHFGSHKKPKAQYGAPRPEYNAPPSPYAAPSAPAYPSVSVGVTAYSAAPAAAAAAYPAGPAAPAYSPAPYSPPAAPTYSPAPAPAYSPAPAPVYSPAPVAPAYPPAPSYSEPSQDYAPPAAPEYSPPSEPSYEPQYPPAQASSDGGYGSFGAGFPDVRVPSDPFGLSPEFNFDPEPYSPPSAGSILNDPEWGGAYGDQGAAAIPAPSKYPSSQNNVPAQPPPPAPTAAAPAPSYPGFIASSAGLPLEVEQEKQVPDTRPPPTRAPYRPTARPPFRPRPTQPAYRPAVPSTAAPPTAAPTTFPPYFVPSTAPTTAPPTTTRPQTYPSYPAYPPYHNYNPQEENPFADQPAVEEVSQAPPPLPEPVSVEPFEVQPTASSFPETPLAQQPIPEDAEEQPALADVDPTNFPSYFESDSDKFPDFSQPAEGAGQEEQVFPDNPADFPSFEPEEPEQAPIPLDTYEPPASRETPFGSKEQRRRPGSPSRFRPNSERQNERQRPQSRQPYEDDPFFSRINSDDAYGPFPFKDIFGDVWPKEEGPSASFGGFGGPSGTQRSRSRTGPAAAVGQRNPSFGQSSSRPSQRQQLSFRAIKAERKADSRADTGVHTDDPNIANHSLSEEASNPAPRFTHPRFEKPTPEEEKSSETKRTGPPRVSRYTSAAAMAEKRREQLRRRFQRKRLASADEE